jgi:hypothetical protein
MNEDWIDDPGRRIAEIYHELAERNAVGSVLLLEYKCPKGCLMLHVFSTPDGRMYYAPRYRLSESQSLKQSDPVARERRTEDGVRKWLSRGGSFDKLLGFFSNTTQSGGLTLTCDHLNKHVLTDQLAADIGGAAPGRPKKKRLPYN